MKYNFDKEIDRSNTNALAAEGYINYLFGNKKAGQDKSFNEEEMISMWVADMQFASAPPAIDAIQERLSHPIFGYTMNFDDELYSAFNSWCERKYSWGFKREELLTAHGVIPTLFDIIDCTCEPDDKIIALTPSYAYFKHAADHHSREFVTSDLINRNGDYFIDFEDFEDKIKKNKIKLFFLCHPHNPTGRVWTEEELLKLGKICFDNDVIVISDEIHCDLLRKDQKHIPFAKLFPEEKRVVTCMAPSKTFNLAGMMIAVVVMPDPRLRAIWNKRTFAITNPLSLSAATGVFKNGHDWLEELRGYLDINFNLVDSFIKEHLPKADFKIPGATYLAWLNLENYFEDDINLTEFFLNNAGVILEGGEMFVENGDKCIRLNLACPTKTVKLALERIKSALDQ